MVQQFRQTGLPAKEIREHTGISERTITRITNEPTVEEVEDTQLRKSRSVGRPSSVAPYEDVIRQWLEDPRAPEDGPIQSQEILRRLRSNGYQGGKSAVYELVRHLRPKKAVVPLVRFEGLPGEFSQHDFGQRKVTFTDGTTLVVRFFASRLKYSRFISVAIVDNEQLESVVRCLLKAFEDFGGVPLKCVFDNMSTVVKERQVQDDGHLKVTWTDRFGQLAIECGFIPVACWPYRPQQKGSIENLVGFVKSNFFCGRRFSDRADVVRQCQEWVNYVNGERACDATGEIPAQRLAREALKPCAYNANTYAFKSTAIVRPTARVHYRGIQYSVPADTIGQSVTLHLQQTQVVIYLGNRLLGEHPRFPENGTSSILAHHAEQLFEFKRGKPYAQRQLLLDLDAMVEPYLTQLVHRRPQSWYGDIEQIYRLYERVGRSDLLAAIALATEERCFGGEYLLAITDGTPSTGLPRNLSLV